LRKAKYAALEASDVATTRWTEIEPKPDNYFFVPKDFGGESEYLSAWGLKDIFAVWQNAVKTDRDNLFMDFDRAVVEERIKTFYSERGLNDSFREEYQVENSSSYDLISRRAKTKFDARNVYSFLYRPFDWRWLYYSPQLTSRPAWQVMQHIVAGNNLGLVFMRQVALQDDYSHFVVSNVLVDNRTFYSNKGITSFAPLYLYDAPDAHQTAMNLGGRRANFSAAFIAEMETRLGLKFAQTFEVSETSKVLTPEDIFHYLYAILHSPTYRQRYAEFLKIDFPRVPLTRDVKLFRALAAFGAELVGLHLLQAPALEKFITRFPVAGSNQVEKIVYAEEWRDASGKTHTGCVFINKTQFFESVAPEIWNFHIGGYQVLDKWLKDRKGRALAYDDITHYQKIVVALHETRRVMNAIDATIPKFPIE
jgi:predicted helicase